MALLFEKENTSILICKGFQIKDEDTLKYFPMLIAENEWDLMGPYAVIYSI